MRRAAACDDMSTRSKIIAVVLVALLALGVIWFTVLREPPLPAPVAVEPTQPDATASTAPDTRRVEPRHSRANPPAEQPEMPAVQTATNLLVDWAERVDQILADDSPLENKARRLLDLLPLMPEPGQIETAEHIANLLPDADFDSFARYLTNMQTSPAVQDIIFADALNRPDSIKLPLLLQTVRTPEHPYATEALEFLEIYLDANHGTNWTLWQEVIDRWLKEHPEPPSETP